MVLQITNKILVVLNHGFPFQQNFDIGIGLIFLPIQQFLNGQTEFLVLRLEEIFKSALSQVPVW